MKIQNLLLLLALLLLGLFTSCNKDDDASSEELLRLDGPNATGPLLAAGVHRFGVRFDPDELVAYEGQQLTALRVFVGLAPSTMRLSVAEGGVVVPGNELSALNVAGSFSQGNFRDYNLVTPVTISSAQTLWLVAEVELPNEQQSIGCDAGPAVDGGDWLWSGDRWLTYRERTNESVNWNIRGVLE